MILTEHERKIVETIFSLQSFYKYGELDSTTLFMFCFDDALRLRWKEFLIANYYASLRFRTT